jgi:hypothetical protein
LSQRSSKKVAAFPTCLPHPDPERLPQRTRWRFRPANWGGKAPRSASYIFFGRGKFTIPFQQASSSSYHCPSPTPTRTPIRTRPCPPCAPCGSPPHPVPATFGSGPIGFPDRLRPWPRNSAPSVHAFVAKPRSNGVTQGGWSLENRLCKRILDHSIYLAQRMLPFLRQPVDRRGMVFLRVPTRDWQIFPTAPNT